ncbi:BrnA antitoxin family protein [Microcystis sp. BLCC-F210]|jgi:uncharacterized protein (DUF4415 family)|uniref:BrnA antitoxin family protein n=1 Tax=Microcystis sp. BLCC-F210 TaxID=3342751 RepID=UPI0035C8F50E
MVSPGVLFLGQFLQKYRKEYDFSKGKRGALISSTGKTRITIYLDDEILAYFREQTETAGMGYQTLINEALKQYIQSPSERSLTQSDLRRILREELSALQ